MTVRGFLSNRFLRIFDVVMGMLDVVTERVARSHQLPPITLGMRFISLLLPVAVVIVPTVLHFFIKLLVLRVRVRHVKCTRMRFVLVVIQLHDLFSVRLERCIVAELCCGGQEVQQHNEHRGGRAVQRPVCI